MIEVLYPQIKKWRAELFRRVETGESRRMLETQIDLFCRHALQEEELRQYFEYPGIPEEARNLL